VSISILFAFFEAILEWLYLSLLNLSISSFWYSFACAILEKMAKTHATHIIPTPTVALVNWIAPTNKKRIERISSIRNI
jgi:hypothetical protein